MIGADDVNDDVNQHETAFLLFLTEFMFSCPFETFAFQIQHQANQRVLRVHRRQLQCRQFQQQVRNDNNGYGGDD